MVVLSKVLFVMDKPANGDNIVNPVTVKVELVYSEFCMTIPVTLEGGCRTIVEMATVDELMRPTPK